MTASFFEPRGIVVPMVTPVTPEGSLDNVREPPHY